MQISSLLDRYSARFNNNTKVGYFLGHPVFMSLYYCRTAGKCIYTVFSCDATLPRHLENSVNFVAFFEQRVEI